MKILIDIDKDTLSRSTGVRYKYAVIHSNRKHTWEFVPSKVTPGEHANRILSLQRDRFQIQQLTGMNNLCMNYSL